MTLSAFIRKNFFILVSLAMGAVYILVPKTGIYDWDKEILYASYIKENLFNLKSLPIFLWNKNNLEYFPVIGHTGLFFGYPETLLFSPSIILLSILEPIAFLKWFFLIHLALAVYGIHLLGQQQKWNTLQFRMFSGLFLLSPFVIQHFAIGYSPWTNLHFFPLFVFFLLHQNRLTSIVGSAAISALVILQGGIHIAVWLLGFLFFQKFWQAVLHNQPRAILDFFWVFFLTLILALVRIYSSYFGFKDFYQPSFSGFSLKGFFIMALKLPFFFTSNIDDIENHIEFYINGVPYWDGGAYWGPFLLLVIILIILAIFSLLKRQDIFSKMKFPEILLSALSLLTLSFGSVYSTITGYISTLLTFPAIESVEKYPFRFTMVAYFGLVLWFTGEGLSLLKEFAVRLKKFIEDTLLYWETKLFSISRQKKFQKVLPGLFLGFVLLLAFWNFLGKPVLFHEIQKAYEGSGFPLIDSLMENKADISINAYLNKAAEVSKWLTAGLITGVLVLGMAIFDRLYQKKIRSYVDTFTLSMWRHRMLFLELLLILPLFVASISWMRVALATPLKSFDWPIRFEPPLAIVSPKNSDLMLINADSEQFSFQCASADLSDCEIALSLNHRDIAYLSIVPAPVTRTVLSGSLKLGIKSGQLYQVSVERTAFFNLTVLTLSFWIFAVGLLIWNKNKL